MMNDAYKSAAAILNRCPSCSANLVRHFCDTTCGINQSEYMKVISTEINNSTKSKFTSWLSI